MHAGCWPTYTMGTCISGTQMTSLWSSHSRSQSCQVCSKVITYFHKPVTKRLHEMHLPLTLFICYAVRTAKFVARKQWIVCGSDDMFVRVYNYNTMDKVKSFEAHTDYIRSIAVHPTQPYLLTCSDDMLIKLWDWDKVAFHFCMATYCPGMSIPSSVTAAATDITTEGSMTCLTTSSCTSRFFSACKALT